MTDIEWAMVHYDGNNDEPYADLVVDALRQKRETDALAAEYGIDAKTMLALARSQIQTTKSNIELSEKLEAAIEDLRSSYIIGTDEDGIPIYDCGLCSICANNKEPDCKCKSSIGELFEWDERRSRKANIE